MNEDSRGSSQCCNFNFTQYTSLHQCNYRTSFSVYMSGGVTFENK